METIRDDDVGPALSRQWPKTAAKKSQLGSLIVSSGNEFERRALPFLRAVWPAIVPAPRLGAWDRKGVDLLVWSHSPPLPVVVQCKGFVEQEVGPDQARQVEESIDRFAASDVEADLYLVVHNRDGRSEAFKTRVAARLSRLQTSGRVRRYDFWDVDTLVNRSYDAVAALVASALRDHSRRLQRHFQGLVRLGEVYVASTPVTVKRLRFSRGTPCRIEDEGGPTVASIHRSLFDPGAFRWTLLSGRFGVGKTTTVLRAAVEGQRSVVLIPCSTFPAQPPASTTELLAHATRSIDLLADFEESDRKILQKIAGAVLGYFMRHPKSPYALVLDGLDEHRGFAHPEGLERLSNQLAELRCPVVLTTRTEHFDAMFGTFGAVFEKFSSKDGPTRPARVFELALWGPAQIADFLSQARAATLLDERERDCLRQLQEAFAGEAWRELYGDVATHPLFLQFIVDDVLDGGLRKASRISLLSGWVERKIRRDLVSWAPGNQTPRASVDPTLDVAEYVARMLELMENVAGLMVEAAESDVVLRESIEAEVVTGEARKIFAGSGEQIVAILLTSILVSHGPRQGRSLRVSFVLRIFQEYFTALHVWRRGQQPDTYPEAVKSFYDELTVDGA